MTRSALKAPQPHGGGDNIYCLTRVHVSPSTSAVSWLVAVILERLESGVNA
jgi:hypothetical protein